MKRLSIIVLFFICIFFSGCNEKRKIENDTITIDTSVIETTSLVENGTLNVTESVDDNEIIKINENIEIKKMDNIYLPSLSVYNYEKDVYISEYIMNTFEEPPSVTEFNYGNDLALRMELENGSDALICEGIAFYYSKNGLALSTVNENTIYKCAQDFSFSTKDDAISEVKKELFELGVSGNVAIDKIYSISEKNCADYFTSITENLNTQDEKENAQYSLFSNALSYDFYRMYFSVNVDNIPVISDDLVCEIGLNSGVIGSTIEIDYSQYGMESFYVCSTPRVVEKNHISVKYDSSDKALTLLTKKIANLLFDEPVFVNDVSIVYCPFDNGQLIPCWLFDIEYKDSDINDYILFNAVNGVEVV